MTFKIQATDDFGPTEASIPKHMRQIPFALYSRADKVYKHSDFYESLPRKAAAPGAQEQSTNATFSYVHSDDESYSAVRVLPSVVLKKTYKKSTTSSQAKAPVSKRKVIKRPSHWTDLAPVSALPLESLERIEKYPMAGIAKLESDEVEAEQNVKQTGSVRMYDRVSDRINAKSDKTVSAISADDVSVPVTSVFEDEYFNSVKSENNLVFISAEVLSALMTCMKSTNTWDIVVKKEAVGDKFRIWFDIRKDSMLSLYAVDGDNDEHVCSPYSFSLESTLIQSKFKEAVTLKSDGSELKFSKDDKEDSMEPYPNAVYRVFKWTSEASGDIEMHVKCHYDTMLSSTQFVSLFALLEQYKIDATGALLPYTDWKQRIDAQRGSILITELKSNAWKLQRFILQSILTGSDQMKIGYMSRISPLSPQKGYNLLGVQFYHPTEFARQCGVDLRHCWGICKSWCELFLKMDDALYVIYKASNSKDVEVLRCEDASILGMETE